MAETTAEDGKTVEVPAWCYEIGELGEEATRIKGGDWVAFCATGGGGEGKGTAAATKQDREVEAFVQAGLPTYKGEFESVAKMIDQMVADVKVLDGRDPDRQV